MVWGPTTSEGLPSEFLGACLLLLLAEREAHGYGLCERMADFGLDADSGTVYRRLRSMEDDGVVVSHWELSRSGPPRRTYALTGDGFRQLERCAASTRDVIALLAEYVERSDIVLAASSDEDRKRGVLVDSETRG